MIGLPVDTVHISAYTAEWTRLFQAERPLIQAAIDPFIRFRDELPQNSATMREYAALKQPLAQQFADDFPTYHAGKSDFIRQVLQRELAEPDRSEQP